MPYIIEARYIVEDDDGQSSVMMKEFTTEEDGDKADEIYRSACQALQAQGE